MQKPYSSAFAKHYRRQTFPIYGARLVFKFILCGSSRSVCACVYVFVCACVRARGCVSAPEAINNQWHDMDLIRLVKQVVQLLYGNCSCYR